MPAWIIKTETYDPDRALWIVEDQRNKGFDAWIEDENGAAVDEQSLKMNGRVTSRPVDGSAFYCGMGCCRFVCCLLDWFMD